VVAGDERRGQTTLDFICTFPSMTQAGLIDNPAIPPGVLQLQSHLTNNKLSRAAIR
jgi:hypothetical protein